jgi:hypothetical protein
MLGDVFCRLNDFAGAGPITAVASTAHGKHCNVMHVSPPFLAERVDFFRLSTEGNPPRGSYAQQS